MGTRRDFMKMLGLGAAVVTLPSWTPEQKEKLAHTYVDRLHVELLCQKEVFTNKWFIFRQRFTAIVEKKLDPDIIKIAPNLVCHMNEVPEEIYGICISDIKVWMAHNMTQSYKMKEPKENIIFEDGRQLYYEHPVFDHPKWPMVRMRWAFVKE